MADLELPRGGVNHKEGMQIAIIWPRTACIFWNWKYKDIYRDLIIIKHHVFILKANYYLSVDDVYFKLALFSIRFSTAE